MVKNQGGNKAKKFASKSFNMSDRVTRYASEEGEVYAVVQRILGNNMCEILAIDGTIKLCVIRGKFSGKGKRDNRLAKGTWILVGTREWEITTKDKQKCDLLEVYSESNYERLKTSVNENWNLLKPLKLNDYENDDDNDIVFTNNIINSELEEEIASELLKSINIPFIFISSISNVGLDKLKDKIWAMLN